jgi:Tol biopolymer transport system component
MLRRHDRKRRRQRITAAAIGIAFALIAVLVAMGVRPSATVPVKPTPSVVKPTPSAGLPLMHNGPITLFGVNVFKQIASNGDPLPKLPTCKRMAFCGGVFGGQEVFGAAWSPATGQLAFSDWCPFGCRSVRRTLGIHVLDVRSGKQRLVAAGNRYTVLAFSADGTRIAFVTFGGQDVISVMNADGSGVTQLPGNLRGQVNSLSWSPDGSRLAYSICSSACGGHERHQMFMVDIDGSHRVALGAGASPTWSPDGTRIAYAARCQVWTMSSDGTNPTRIADLKEQLGGFPCYEFGGPAVAWSPDGTELAVLVFVDPGWEPDHVHGMENDRSYLVVMNADGSGAHVVWHGGMPVFGHASEAIVWRPVPR